MHTIPCRVRTSRRVASVTKILYSVLYATHTASLLMCIRPTLAPSSYPLLPGRSMLARRYRGSARWLARARPVMDEIEEGFELFFQSMTTVRPRRGFG